MTFETATTVTSFLGVAFLTLATVLDEIYWTFRSLSGYSLINASDKHESPEFISCILFLIGWGLLGGTFTNNIYHSSANSLVTMDRSGLIVLLVIVIFLVPLFGLVGAYCHLLHKGKGKESTIHGAVLVAIFALCYGGMWAIVVYFLVISTVDTYYVLSWLVILAPVCGVIYFLVASHNLIRGPRVYVAGLFRLLTIAGYFFFAFAVNGIL
jgi:hypothetical protein